MRERLKIWTLRYLPAEIASSVMAIFASFTVRYFHGGDIWLALVATWAEVATFYLFILAREFRDVRTLSGGLRKIRNLLMEFGFAEVVDMFMRPVCIYWGVQFLPNLILGVLVGKIIADFVFYFLTVSSFELLRKISKDW